MTRSMLIIVYIVLMVLLIVGVDFMFFKDRFLARLLANIGIVLIFAAFYLRFFY